VNVRLFSSYWLWVSLALRQRGMWALHVFKFPARMHSRLSLGVFFDHLTHHSGSTTRQDDGYVASSSLCWCQRCFSRIPASHRPVWDDVLGWRVSIWLPTQSIRPVLRYNFHLVRCRKSYYSCRVKVRYRCIVHITRFARVHRTAWCRRRGHNLRGGGRRSISR